MLKKELSAWTLLLSASLLGSLTIVLLSGCKPPAPSNVDVSIDQAGSDDAATSSNVTASSSNVTTAGEPVSETPLPTAGEDQADTESQDTESQEAESAPDDSPASADEAAGASNEQEAEATALVAVVVAESVSPEAVRESGGDWPQWGGTRERNNVPGAKNLPLEWNIGKFDRRTGDWDDSKAVNVAWFANLGSQTYGNPVVADGRVFVGTNNGAGHIQRYPSNVDLGCLLAFNEENGDFLWQHSSEKLITGRVHDWPLQGICCAPLVEGERLWFVTSRGEVRCLDTQGFHDDEDDGPVVNEPAYVAEFMSSGPTAASYTATIGGLGEGKLDDTARKLLADAGEEVEGDVQVETVTEGKAWKLSGNFGGVDRVLTARQIGPRLSFFKTLGTYDKRDADVIWIFDMMGELGVSQHNMCSCSVTSYGDLLFVNTSNGLDESHLNLPAPDAPSFICMNKNTGEVLWTDKSPGKNILHGQWSSPAVGVFEGVPQALFAGGDGILYSFRADAGKDGKPELLWKFDCNPKTSKWVLGGEGTRNNLIATPVAYDGLVYIAVGQDPEHGEGEGHLWCIDPNKRGDISPTLADEN